MGISGNRGLWNHIWGRIEYEGNYFEINDPKKKISQID